MYDLVGAIKISRILEIFVLDMPKPQMDFGESSTLQLVQDGLHFTLCQIQQLDIYYFPAAVFRDISLDTTKMKESGNQKPLTLDPSS